MSEEVTTSPQQEETRGRDSARTIDTILSTGFDLIAEQPAAQPSKGAHTEPPWQRYATQALACVGLFSMGFATNAWLADDTPSAVAEKPTASVTQPAAEQAVPSSDTSAPKDEAVTAPMAEPAADPAPKAPPKPERVYVVRRGESLSLIARRTLGSSKRWNILLEANRDVLTDPRRIEPGMRLVIPDPLLAQR